MRCTSSHTLIPLLAIAYTPQLVSAQYEDDARYEIHAPSPQATTEVANAAVVSPVHQTAPARIVLPGAAVPANGGNYSLQFLGGINPKDPVLDSIKRVMNSLTEEAEATDLRIGDLGGVKASTADLGYSFDSNTQSYSWPMDNSLAISDQDVIVAASNGGVMIHRYDGTLLASYDWTQFAGEPCFDPRVFYDAEDNRFVMVALHGNTPATSKLKVMFSPSIDPVQPWYIYDITAASVANYIGTGKWFDYPTLGISDDEVFVSVDVRNTGFVENVVFQMDHSDGYAGSPMNWVIWTGISNSPLATPILGQQKSSSLPTSGIAFNSSANESSPTGTDCSYSNSGSMSAPPGQQTVPLAMNTWRNIATLRRGVNTVASGARSLDMEKRRTSPFSKVSLSTKPGNASTAATSSSKFGVDGVI